MKSYPEMFQDSIDMTDGSTTITERDYKAIQLDAYRAGMLRAAEIVNERSRLLEKNNAKDLIREHYHETVIVATAINLKPEDVN